MRALTEPFLKHSLVSQFLLSCYKKKKKHAPYQEFYKNGSLKTVGNFLNDKREGVFKTYHENGMIKSESLFENDQIILQKEFDNYGSLIPKSS